MVAQDYFGQLMRGTLIGMNRRNLADAAFRRTISVKTLNQVFSRGQMPSPLVLVAVLSMVKFLPDDINGARLMQMRKEKSDGST